MSPRETPASNRNAGVIPNPEAARVLNEISLGAIWLTRPSPVTFERSTSVNSVRDSSAPVKSTPLEFGPCEVGAVQEGIPERSSPKIARREACANERCACNRRLLQRDATQDRAVEPQPTEVGSRKVVGVSLLQRAVVERNLHVQIVRPEIGDAAKVRIDERRAKLRESATAHPSSEWVRAGGRVRFYAKLVFHDGRGKPLSY
jgi:hypothetical protein